MDVFTLLGVFVSGIAVLGGQFLEGGTFTQLVQGTSILIVVGGTLGATLVSFPSQDIRNSLSLFPLLFSQVKIPYRSLMNEIIEVAQAVRKDGLLALDGQRVPMHHPLFKKGMKHVVNGLESKTVREILETEIELIYEEKRNAVRVIEKAGSFAPAIGIVGAVLGLIQVMNQLDDPSRIGAGVAAAFVSTLYGLIFAHFILLPAASNLKAKLDLMIREQELVKEGVIGIQEGLNPQFLQDRLEVYAQQTSQAYIPPAQDEDEEYEEEEYEEE